MKNRLLYLVIILFIISNSVVYLNYTKQVKNIKRIRHTSGELENAVINTQNIAYTFVGARFQFSFIKNFRSLQSNIDFIDTPIICLIFDELSCNVCQDDETKFALELTEKYGLNKAVVIVKSKNIRYIQNYVRMNNINFKVYYCNDDRFFKANNIMVTPLALVIDEMNHIVAAHIPIVGHPQYSIPFHFFCFDYFESSK